MHKSLHRYHADVFSEVHILVSVRFLNAVSLVQEKRYPDLICTDIEHKTSANENIFILMTGRENSVF